MATKTLLEIVVDILNDMDSDLVDSITDTEEAYQVAQIVKTTYEEIINDRYWPHLSTLTTLTASGDATKPTHMTINDDIQAVEWLKYNKRTSTDTKDKYVDVEYKEPKEFVELLNARNSSSTNTDSIVDDSGVILFILTDIAPSFYTSFDDSTLVFDAYDSGVDSTLQGSKTQAQVYKEVVFTLSDSFVPDLPAKAFPYLQAEAKSVTFNALRQASNQKEEQRSRRQRTWLAREKWRNNGFTKTPDYGRKA